MAWIPEVLGVGHATSDRPALAVFNGRLFALHKGQPAENGAPEDQRLWYSSFDGQAWSGESPMGGNSSTRPSLAVFNGRLFAAWKGVEGDNAMWLASFDGTNWTGAQKGIGFATSDGPAIAVFNGRLYGLHKGEPGDNRLWFSSSSDGQTWSGEQPVGAWANSSTTPSLAVFNGRLFAAWKGEGNDYAMWVASFDGTTWTEAGKGIGFATSDGPSLAVYNGLLFGAHSGEPGDVRWWYSHFDGNTWAPEHPAAASTTGLSLAAFNGRLYAAWKGASADPRLWYSSYPGNPSISLTDEVSLLHVTGQGFTHDGTVSVTYTLTDAQSGDLLQKTDTVKTDDNGAFVHDIPLPSNWANDKQKSEQVTVTDNDSLETATASLG